MALGISNIVIGALILAVGFWQRASVDVDASAGLVTGLFVAGAGAVSIGAYQLWRQKYVYR